VLLARTTKCPTQLTPVTHLVTANVHPVAVSGCFRRSATCQQVIPSQRVARFSVVGLESAFKLISRDSRQNLERAKMNLIIGRAAGRKSKLSLLPLLVGLFVISYGMLTTLVVLQDKTIDSQRGLIHALFQDSIQLSAMKMHQRPSGNHFQTSSEAQSKVAAQVPSSQAAPSPEMQVAPKQVPSAVAKQSVSGKNRKSSKKVERPLPMRPPAELTDPSDMRRVKFSI
jgi:hypothetical protein